VHAVGASTKTAEFDSRGPWRVGMKLNGEESRGKCRWCKQRVTTNKQSLRGKDQIGYFHVECNPAPKPHHVQVAANALAHRKIAEDAARQEASLHNAHV